MLSKLECKAKRGHDVWYVHTPGNTGGGGCRSAAKKSNSRFVAERPARSHRLRAQQRSLRAAPRARHNAHFVQPPCRLDHREATQHD